MSISLFSACKNLLSKLPVNRISIEHVKQFTTGVVLVTHPTGLLFLFLYTINPKLFSDQKSLNSHTKQVITSANVDTKQIAKSQ